MKHYVVMVDEEKEKETRELNKGGPGSGRHKEGGGDPQEKADLLRQRSELVRRNASVEKIEAIDKVLKEKHGMKNLGAPKSTLGHFAISDRQIKDEVRRTGKDNLD